MKIDLFDFIFCYIMRHKLVVIATIVSVNIILLTDVKAIIVIPICLIALLFNVWYNSMELFECHHCKIGYFKKRMYKKYKEAINFKCVLIYNENSLEYQYICFEDLTYFKCNIYLFVIKTFKSEKFLEYETRYSRNIIFMSSSKKQVAEYFYKFLILKSRKINEKIRSLESVNDKYSKLQEEVECDKI